MYMNYPPIFPFYPQPTERQKTLLEQLEEAEQAERAWKAYKKRLTEEKDGNDDNNKNKKRKTPEPPKFTFLETLSLLMLFSVPVTLFQLWLLAYVRHAIQ